MRIRNLLVFGAIVAACASGGCSDPQLVLPQPLALRGRFDDAQLAPVAATRLRLGVEPAESSVRWKARSDSEWIKLGAQEGGAPVELDVRFDFSRMDYGDNASTIFFEVGKQVLTLPVSYRLEGALVIDPAQSLELTGRVGEPTTKAIELRVTSPGKDGLPWRLRFDDPWLAASAAEGRTPSVIQVSANIERLTQNVTGRMTLEAPLAWRGSPLVLPVATTLLDVALVRKQVDARRKKINAEREALSKELADWLEKPGDEATIEELHEHVKKFGREAEAMAARLLPLFDELETFLVQMKAYETECSFSEVRSSLAASRKELEGEAKIARAISKTVKLVKEDISASAEWQRIKGIQLAKGDTIHTQCDGDWNLGAVAGVYGAEGGDGYLSDRVIGLCPFGSLMVRAGDEILVFGDGSNEVSKGGGRLEARCNDSDYGNNSGSIRVSVLIIPNPATLVK